MSSRPAANPDLDELVRLYYQDVRQLGSFEPVDGKAVPEPYQALLNHEHHMTVTVEQHHGCSVNVDVLEFYSGGDTYHRKILLRRSDNDQAVQFGIVRLRLDTLDEAIREEIESRKFPLGRILISHNVLRQVKLGQLWKVHPGPELCRLFNLSDPVDTYGRTAIIYCNGEPAIELLEIVAPESISQRWRSE